MSHPLFLAVAIAGLQAVACAWTVRTAADCPPWEKAAAEILRTTLAKRVTGDITVGGRDDVVFHVGETDRAKAQGLSALLLKDEEWVVLSSGADVVLAGGGTHGALYAVSHFLEDDCGVRFWSETETDIPISETMALPPLNRRGRPVFRYRNIFRTSDRKRSTPRFAVLRRLNANDGVPLGRDFGGEVSYGPPFHCHTFDRMLPWSEYGTDHPEWFSLWEGRRTGGQYGGQLCLSNPEVRAKLLEALRANVAQGIAEAGKRGVPPPKFYDVSQNDASARFCQCANCIGEIGKYGHSGFYLNMVNELADAIAADRPEVFLTTLAYEFTEDPPKAGIRPRRNVIVKLCNTRSNRVAGFRDPSNEPWRTCLTAWGKIAENLHVWDYAIVYSNPGVYLPLPNEFLMADRFRSYRDNRVSGVFLEHEHGDRVDMYELKFYLETRLLEDPDQDADLLIADFMDGYYGRAGREILSARRLLFGRARREKASVGFMPRTSAYDFISKKDAECVAEAFDRAEALVCDDARLLSRVRKARQASDRLYRLRQVEVDQANGVVAWLPTALFTSASDRAGLVDDPTSPSGGRAVRLTAPDVEFQPPYGFEIYDAPAGKVTSSGVLSGEGSTYAWSEFPGVDVPKTENSFLYLTRDWTVQVRLCHPELNGGRFTLRILHRREGRNLFIARIEFVRPRTPDRCGRRRRSGRLRRGCGTVSPKGKGPGSGPFQTNQTKFWMQELGVKRHFPLIRDCVFE